MAAPMSFVWTWQFQVPSPPTTTIESPISPHRALRSPIRASSRAHEVHHLVALLADVELAVDARRAAGDGLEGVAARAGGVGRWRPAAARRRRRGGRRRGAARTRRRRRRRRRRRASTGSRSGVRARASPACTRAARARRPGRRHRRQRRRCRLGALAHDGEDRALDRLEHGLVRRRRRRRQARRPAQDRRGRRARLERGRDAPQDLGEDHAAVAAGAHQRAVADRVARRRQLGGRSVDLGHDGVQRAGHVGAGVAVGHRVDVEPVQGLLVVAHEVAEHGEHGAEGVDGEAVQRALQRRHRDMVGASPRTRMERPPHLGAIRPRRRSGRAQARIRDDPRPGPGVVISGVGSLA